MQEVVAIEHTKISDSIQLEFGFDLDHLMNAIAHHKIDMNNAELKAFSMKIVKEQRQALAKREFDAARPSP